MTMSGLSSLSGLSSIVPPCPPRAAVAAGWVAACRLSDNELLLPFEETSGSTTSDRSGNGRHGTLSGSATFSTEKSVLVPGGGTGSLALGPATGDVTVADAEGLRFSSGSPLSIGTWFRLTSWDSGTSVLLTKGDEYTTINYMLRVEVILGVNGKAIDFVWTNANNSYNIVRMSVTLSLDTWYHVAVTHTFGSTGCLMYLNGVSLPVTTITGSMTNAPQTSTDSLRLGWAQYPSLPVHRVIGQMDDVRIYRAILSQSDVSCLAGVAANND